MNFAFFCNNYISLFGIGQIKSIQEMDSEPFTSWSSSFPNTFSISWRYVWIIRRCYLPFVLLACQDKFAATAHAYFSKI